MTADCCEEKGLTSEYSTRRELKVNASGGGKKHLPRLSAAKLLVRGLYFSRLLQFEGRKRRQRIRSERALAVL